ncbi:hypothetical protein [Natrialba sp. INN-245]|uniref:hypothetical protein n=1 Tax=Natrialba sp. INN-245 TaxID=2690967 RepID=UPI001313BE93|nr:hypothetical protein [Natrialba sp. INN-245]MWV38836.1 hypothetical protein [Natrialba sp. INN-245]
MVAIERQLEAVHKMGGIALELLEIGATPATFDCPLDEDGRLLLEEEEGYWQNLTEMKTLLEGYGEPKVTDPELDVEDSLFETARAIEVERAIDEDVAWKIEIIYYAYGLASISGRILVDDGEKNVFNSYLNPPEEGAYELTPVDIGRLVAKAELQLLAEQLGSSAATLDYWMVEELPPSLQLTQTEWGEVRGVSRQAVNENVNEAKQQFERN